MSNPDSAKEFYRALENGAESATEELDRRYREKLCRLVEREMDQRFRRREDPEDVVQSVFRTFFRRAARGEFQIDHSGALWNLLQRIARRKVLKHVEYHDAEKRTPRAEVYLEGDNLPAREPTVRESVLLGDAIENALAGLKAPEPEILRLQLNGYSIAEIVESVLGGLESPYPEILHMRLQGCTEPQIAVKLGCGREAVRYRLKRICRRLRRLFRGDSEG